MRYQYNSKFAGDIKEFLKFRSDLGYSEASYDHKLLQFDKYCCIEYPNESVLTEQIVKNFCRLRENESKNGLATRANAIREFGKFQKFLGKDAYIIPKGLYKFGDPPPPYIYTDEELILFFRAADHFCPKESKWYYNSYIIPVLFRIMFYCGLRPQEVPRIKKDNIDLKKGILLIEESKERKDRIIPLSDQLLEICDKYEYLISKVMPCREYYFSPKRGGKIPIFWMRYAFYNCWDLAGVEFPKNHAPRNYDWRHNFATRNISKWLEEGKDIGVLLPILSSYMGHENLEQTLYYVTLQPSHYNSSNLVEWQCSIPIPEYDD